MKKYIGTVIIIFFIFGLMSVVLYGSINKKQLLTSNTINPGPPVLFYSITCPHCTEVRAWMSQQQIDKKFKVIEKEVYNNSENNTEMMRVAKGCGLPEASVGVPILYAEGKCFIGTTDVINYLSKKAAISNK